MGYCAKAQGMHFQYQANRIKHGNVLSIIFIGLEVVKRKQEHLFKEHCDNAFKYLFDFQENNFAD